MVCSLVYNLGQLCDFGHCGINLVLPNITALMNVVNGTVKSTLLCVRGMDRFQLFKPRKTRLSP